MFGRGRRQAEQSRAEQAWRQLPEDDDFVQRFADPGEVVWNGINAIDWTLRRQPGVPREFCESLLVLTDRRLLIMTRTPSGEPGIISFRLSSMRPATAKGLGAQGILTIHIRTDSGEWRSREYSMPRAVAPVFATRLNSYIGTSAE